MTDVTVTTTVKIKLGGKETELTREEALLLCNELKTILGENKEVPLYIPSPIYKIPFYLRTTGGDTRPTPY